MTRSRILARLAGFGLSMALSCAAYAQAIVVGAKEFTEQLLVAEMTTQLLQANGFGAHKGTGFATTGIRSLQERGIIDLYWEYTGTIKAVVTIGLLTSAAAWTMERSAKAHLAQLAGDAAKATPSKASRQR
jgi:glycine betaine/choline ABC-type transport system substrate-binding protein